MDLLAVLTAMAPVLATVITVVDARLWARHHQCRSSSAASVGDE